LHSKIHGFGAVVAVWPDRAFISLIFPSINLNPAEERTTDFTDDTDAEIS
jgi:hypothetical protein